MPGICLPTQYKNLVSTRLSADECLEAREENINHLVFRSEPVETKFPIYRSKFSKQVRDEVKRAKDCHRTFGLPKEMLAPQPLKKGTRRVIRPNVDKTKPNLPPKMKVPTRKEWILPPQREHPNFKLRNMINAVRMKPPQGPSRMFDTASGRRYHACNLLVPQFCLGKNYCYAQEFGKVPKYLQDVKEKVAKEREERQKKEAEEEEMVCRRISHSALPSKRTAYIKKLPDRDRKELLDGLKRAWEELTKEFKRLPMVVDSVPMIKKKRNLERMLNDIEKNIDLLERPNYDIYVNELDTPYCQQA